jgi:hypothetical protein
VKSAQCVQGVGKVWLVVKVYIFDGVVVVRRVLGGSERVEGGGECACVHVCMCACVRV